MGRNMFYEDSKYVVLREEQAASDGMAEIAVEVVAVEPDAAEARQLPARVIVTASDGTHPDGSANGVYDDGRFFIDGSFTVTVPPGRTGIYLYSGPNYVPLTMWIDVAAGRKLSVRAFLYQWFSPEERGWYGGDNHVHSQHDQTAKMKTGLSYTVLQGRANGLSYITEAGSHVSYDHIEQFSDDRFLLKYAAELAGACYMGHFITPGISEPLSREMLDKVVRKPLPGQAVAEAVHSRGGVMIYTHPLTPPHQLHWMGAAGALSDAVLGRCADAFDVDSKATELLWFAMLNLGNKIACSSYTDCTLERFHTLTPGDRRVYSHADEFSYPAIVEAVREGHTFSTNGGPLFAFFSIDGRGPGDAITRHQGSDHEAYAEIHSLYPLKKAELYRRGVVVKTFEVTGSSGQSIVSHSFGETEQSWYLLRVEDENGNWCMTSPIYFEPGQAADRPFASTILFEIANHSRFVYLSKAFFAHLLVTVSPDHSIVEVQLMKDGKVMKSFTPDMGDQLSSGQIPVTQFEQDGQYALGWMWPPETERKVHFQADYPVTESGWYSVRAVTANGVTLNSDAVYFDGMNPYSHELTAAYLSGGDTEFRLWGYGEEMLLEDVKEPYEDRWWYPNHSGWRIMATFGDKTYEMQGEHPYDVSYPSKALPPKLARLFKSSGGNNDAG